VTAYPWVVSCLNGGSAWWHGCPARPGPGLHDGCPVETRAGRTVSVVVLDVDGAERVQTVGDQHLRPAGQLEAGPPIGGRGWSRRVEPHPLQLPYVEDSSRPRRKPKPSRFAAAAHLLDDVRPGDPLKVHLARLTAFVEACEQIEAGQVVGQAELFGQVA
jgi:hypothetical protein